MSAAVFTLFLKTLKAAAQTPAPPPVGRGLLHTYMSNRTEGDTNIFESIQLDRRTRMSKLAFLLEKS